MNIFYIKKKTVTVFSIIGELVELGIQMIYKLFFFLYFIVSYVFIGKTNYKFTKFFVYIFFS